MKKTIIFSFFALCIVLCLGIALSVTANVNKVSDNSNDTSDGKLSVSSGEKIVCEYTQVYLTGLNLYKDHIYRIAFTPSSDMTIGTMTNIISPVYIKLCSDSSYDTIENPVYFKQGTVISAGTSVSDYFVPKQNYENCRLALYVFSEKATLNIKSYMSIEDVSYNGGTAIDELNDIKSLLNKFTEANRGYWYVDGGGHPEKNFTVMQFSDIHGSSENALRIRDFINKFSAVYTDDNGNAFEYINQVVHLGDTVNSRYENGNNFWTDAKLNNVINILGNHDVMTDNEYDDNISVGTSYSYISVKRAYDTFISPFISSWGVESTGEVCYFYKDFAEYNIRMIFLDNFHFDYTQENWLEETLSDAQTKGFSVIMCNHDRPGRETPIPCSFTSFEKQNEDSGVLLNQAAESVGKYIDNGGSFICWLTGDAHFDGIYRLTGDTRQLVIAVNRTSSPNKGAATGALSSGATVYYGDVLTITYTASTGYSIVTCGSTAVCVTGNVNKDTIYATAQVNKYTYNIVYKSSNGTALGTSNVKKEYGTTNTITAPDKSGYTTPASQSVVWNSTTAKTITFVYKPIAVSSASASGSIYDGLSYTATVSTRNRTATSVEVQISITSTLAALNYNPYSQNYTYSVGGKSGSVQICGFNSDWRYSTSSARSVTGSSGWITVSLSTTNATTMSLSYYYWEGNSQGTNMNAYDGPDKSGSITFNIAAY